MIDIAEKKDVQRLEAKIDKLLMFIDSNDIKQPGKVLTSNEIRMRLGNISRQTFQNKLEELVGAGMFKDGHWKMYEKDLQQYLIKKQYNGINS